MDYVKRNIRSISGIIVSDYSKGVVTKALVAGLVKAAKETGIPVAVDPKVNHFDYYKGVTVVTPNNLEASQAAGIDIADDTSLAAAGRKLLDRLKNDSVLITRGEHGMSLFRREETPIHIPTVAKDVYDVTGAGDTVIAVFMLALAAGRTNGQGGHDCKPCGWDRGGRDRDGDSKAGAIKESDKKLCINLL